MSLQIKSLTTGAPVIDNSPTAPSSDFFNLIPTANSVYDLYAAPNTTTAKRAAIVKSIRIANSRVGNGTVKVTYLTRTTAIGQNRRRLLTPPDLLLPDGFTYIDDGEITLEPGDKIQAEADVGNVIQYIISGVERDVT